MPLLQLGFQFGKRPQHSQPFQVLLLDLLSEKSPSICETRLTNEIQELCLVETNKGEEPTYA